MPKHVILNAAVGLPEGTLAELAELFDVVDLPRDPEAARAVLAAEGGRIEALTMKFTRINAEMLAAMPKLEMISSYTAGLDTLDQVEAKRRGIKVTNTSHILADEVANLAVGMAISATRCMEAAGAYLRRGDWAAKGDFKFTRSLAAMTVGVVGLGSIGLSAATRLQAIGARVVYTGPNKKPVDYPYYTDLTEMAADCDMLLLACPLTDATRHSVNASVLKALGREGYIVNVARGPVIDEEAMVAALVAGELAGVALDVYEHEPNVPQALLDHPNALLLPHMGSATHETRQRMANQTVDALVAHFGIKGPRG